MARPEFPTGRREFQLLWSGLKIIVSIVLICIVFWKLDLRAAWEKSQQLSGVVILVVLSMFFLQTCIAALRWWIILRHQQFGIDLMNSLRICFIGAFFNQLLPSSFGGDVARVWYLYRAGFRKGNSVVTVLSDRVYGMLTLVCCAAFSFPVLIYYSIGRQALIGVFLLIMCAFSALCAAFCLDRLPKWMQLWPLIRHLGSLSQSMRAITADRRAIIPLLGLSFLVHAVTILASSILIGAVAPGFNILLCAALIPVIMLVSMTPISIAGWGVREGAMVYGLGLAHVPSEAALIVSIFIGISLAAVGIVGGLMLFLQNGRDRTAQQVL